MGFVKYADAVLPILIRQINWQDTLTANLPFMFKIFRNHRSIRMVICFSFLGYTKLILL